jgi:multiple sugar transport system permease protein
MRRYTGGFSTIIKQIVLGLIAFGALIPFILILITSLKIPAEAVMMNPELIFRPTLQNYTELVGRKDFLRSILNSLILAGSSTILATLIATYASYTLSRFKFRGNNLASYLILFLRVVPPIILIIPYFLIWRRLRLSDTYIAMILMYITFSLPLLIWMIRSFFIDVPVEMEEAAMIDGCTRWQMLRMVLIPSIRPGILAAATLSFILIWNDFVFALFNTGRQTRTLPIEIYNSLGFLHLDWARLSASAVIAILPAILFIGLVQKYIVRGLTMGAIKG